MYQVLYRKWRPTTFADVSGQPQVTVTLQNELKSGRINHAYLFTGTRGTGKTTCAKILAKAVNCLNPVDGNPCGECEICGGIENGNILDIVEIDAASNNGVNNIRSLQDEAAFTPAKAKYRVYIIDEVHMLSSGAFNALLKTLEEPPSHVIFILATTEVHKLPATILSRCQRFDFHRIAPDVIADRLMYVAQQEKVSLTREGAMLIASVSDGAFRDSLSLLDRCIGIDTNVTDSLVRTAAGLADKEYLFALTDSITQKDSPRAITLIDSLYNQSKDMGRLADELTAHYRALMLIKTMKDSKQLIVMSAEEYARAEKQANQLALAEILYSMDVLQSSNQKTSANKRFELEMAVIKLCSPEMESTTEALLARIARLENMVKQGAVTPVQQSQVQEIQQAQQASPEITQSNSTAEDSYPTQESVYAEDSSANIQNVQAIPDGPTPTERIAKEAEKQKEQIIKQETEKQNGEQNGDQQDNNSRQAESQPVATEKKPVDFKELVENAKPMEDWGKVIEALTEYSKVIAASFEGTSAYISGDYLLIDAKSDIPFKLLRQSAQRDKMRLVVKQVTGRHYKLGPYKRDSQQQAKNDLLAGLTEKIKDAGIQLTEVTDNN